MDHPLRGDNVGSLALVDLKGNRTALSARGAQGLAWSPAGNEVWVSSGGRLLAVSISGREREVARVPGGLWVEDVSRDGKVLLAHTNIRREIAGLAPGEAKERNLSWFDWSFLSDLSADGRMVLFMEQNRASDAGYAVYSRKTDGSPAVRLGDGNALALSPDGKWVLSILRPFSDAQLMLLPVGAGQPRTLPAVGNIRYQPWASWLPEGKRVLVAGTESGHEARLYVRDLEEPKPVP